MRRRSHVQIFAAALALAAALAPVAEAQKTDLASLQAALARLAPERPDERDVYVLSLGLWDEHVFDNEAREAAAILARRFKAETRTLTITNGDGSGKSALPATPATVEAAIRGVAAKLDPGRDIFVLFITSHGARDGAAVIRRNNQDIGAVTPADLARWLDETGVAQRLVIVSACYSGAFIPPLAGEGTIVLTAAASDRTSFGCEAQRDWTYFGDAFFNQALRRKRTLLQAFAEAKAIVGRAETIERLPPSRPSASVGAGAQGIVDAAGDGGD